MNRDVTGREHARHFGHRATAQGWLDEQTARLVAGTHVTPRQARSTVGEWCDTWLAGYRGHRPSTVRRAEVHIAWTRTVFGHQRLSDIRPSHLRTYDAVPEHLRPRSCSATSPASGWPRRAASG